MPLIQVSGVEVGAPSLLTLPLTGRAVAELTLAERTVPFKAHDTVQVAIEGGQTYSMFVERVGSKGGFTSAYLVGGAGGLSTEIGPKFYSKIAARKVLEELLADCGEQAGTIDLPGTLPMWIRGAGPAHEALRALMMRYPERVWRMSPAGQVDVGVPDWKPHEGTLELLNEDAAAGSYTVFLMPSLEAGQSVTFSRGSETFSKRVTRVSHSLSEEYGFPGNVVTLRSHLGTGDGEDLGVSGLEAIAQRATRWTDYLALYDCEVLRDHGDHTLDLRPLNPQIPELTRVRLVQPVPGARVKLKAGGTVLLSFQAGDPSRPVVLHYGAATLERLEIVTGKGQLIRLDDDRGEVSPEDALYQRPSVTLQDAAGQSVELWAQAGQEHIRLTDKAGQMIELNAAAKTITIQGGGPVNVTTTGHVGVTGSTISLNGGPAVARLGDMVQVVGVTPGAATVTGTIISGSPTVTAG